MNKMLKISAFLGAVALSAGTAQAETIIFDPLGVGEDTISSSGFDNYLAVDLNRDGNSDLSFGIQVSALGGAFVRGVGLPTPTPPEPDPEAGIFPYAPFEADAQEVRISQTLFTAGQTIGADTFGVADNNIYLYGRRSSSAENILPNVGDSGIFGVRIQTGRAMFSQGDGIGQTGGFLDTTPVETFFGFIEIRHGSIVIGNAGFQTTAGASILAGVPTNTTPVPLPAGGALLMTGLFGLAALRRRQKTTA